MVSKLNKERRCYWHDHRTLDFLYMSPSRVFLCLYWLLMVITTVTIWAIMLDFTSMLERQNGYNTEKKILTSSLNKKRKLFHVLAVLLFVPGVIFEVRWWKYANILMNHCNYSLNFSNWRLALQSHYSSFWNIYDTLRCGRGGKIYMCSSPSSLTTEILVLWF